MNSKINRFTSVIMAIALLISMVAFDTTSAFAGTKGKAKRPGKVKLISVKIKKPSYKYQKLRVYVKWNKKGRYRKYQIYCRIGSGKWKKIKTVKLGKKAKLGTYLVKVKINKTYKFKVRAINKTAKGKFSNVKTIRIPNGVKIGKDKYLIGDNRLDDRSDHNAHDEPGSGNDDSTSGGDDEIQSTTSVTIINPDNGKFYNGGGSAIPMYIKTKLPLDDVKVFIAPSSYTASIGKVKDDFYDKCEEFILEQNAGHYYDVAFPNNTTYDTHKGWASWTTVAGGFLYTRRFGEGCSGSYEDDTWEEFPAENYKIIVVEDTADYTKIVAVSKVFKLNSYKAYHEAWIQDVLTNAAGDLGPESEYVNLCKTSGAYQAAKQDATLRKVLKAARYLFKTHDYATYIDDPLCELTSIRDAHKPQVSGHWVCGQASNVFISFLTHEGITAMPKASTTHQTTIVIINGKTYNIDITPVTGKIVKLSDKTLEDVITRKTENISYYNFENDYNQLLNN